MPDIMKMGDQPNFLGSWDVEELPGKELVLTIAKIIDEDVVGDGGRKERCTVVHWKEPYKPMILNITNKKRIIKLYKTKDTDSLVGKRLVIVTEKVHAFGDVYDALRVKPIIPAEKTSTVVKCTDCGNPITAAASMTAEQIINGTKKKYGVPLCVKCGSARASKAKAEAEAKTEAEVNTETNEVKEGDAE